MGHRRVPHRPVSVSASHWRANGQAKVRFDSRAQALSAAEERSSESGVALGAYRCDYCAGWHMGRPGRRRPEA